MNTCKDCKHWRRGGCFDRCQTLKGTPRVYPSDRVEYVMRDGRITGAPPAELRTVICVIVTDPKQRDGICLHRHVESDYVDGWMKRKSRWADDGVFATSDDERGELRTGPDFGCIHFEPRGETARYVWNPI